MIPSLALIVAIAAPPAPAPAAPTHYIGRSTRKICAPATTLPLPMTLAPRGGQAKKVSPRRVRTVFIEGFVAAPSTCRFAGFESSERRSLESVHGRPSVSRGPPAVS